MNLPLGVWLIAAPWLLDGIASPLGVWNGMTCGALRIVLAIPRGRVKVRISAIADTRFMLIADTVSR